MHTVPVDPYDLFRGEYVALNYKEISQFDTAAKFEEDQEVFVILASSPEKRWKISSVSAKLPKVKADQIFLKGRVKHFYLSGKRLNNIAVDYGVERLYMPEGRSRELERDVKELTVDVSVGLDGTPVIKHVKIHDKMVYDGTNMLDPFKDNR